MTCAAAALTGARWSPPPSVCSCAMDESGALSLTLIGDEAIRALNRDYRGKDTPTDVLSFPMDGPGTPLAGERLLGDVVISVDTARRQAADYDAPLQREIYRLLIHGLLHLHGPRSRARRATACDGT